MKKKGSETKTNIISVDKSKNASKTKKNGATICMGLSSSFDWPEVDHEVRY